MVDERNITNSGIWRTHARATSLFKSLTDFSNIENDAIKRRGAFLEDLLALQTANELSLNQKALEICKKIEERVFWNVPRGKRFSTEEKTEILNACDEIRLYTVALALLGNALDNNSSQTNLQSLVDLAQGHIPFPMACMAQVRGGISYSSFFGKTIILLGGVHSDSECVATISALQAINELMPPENDWIVDCSTLESMPLALFESLTKYRSLLGSRGKELLLCWVPPKMETDELMVELKAQFKLQSMRGYYFTRAGQKAS